MKENNEIKGFAFGQYFTCDCCKERMLVAHKGLLLLDDSKDPLYLLPLSANPGRWEDYYEKALSTGHFVRADLCGKCGTA